MYQCSDCGRIISSKMHGKCMACRYAEIRRHARAKEKGLARSMHAKPKQIYILLVMVKPLLLLEYSRAQPLPLPRPVFQNRVQNYCFFLKYARKIEKLIVQS